MSGMNGRMGWVVPCLTLIVLGTIATCLPAPAEAGPTTHPVYDDGDTLRWYASLSEAQRVARREGIFLLVEVSPARSKPCANVIALIGDKQVRYIRCGPVPCDGKAFSPQSFSRGRQSRQGKCGQNPGWHRKARSAAAIDLPRPADRPEAIIFWWIIR